MSSPGTDAGRDRPLDPNLAKALSHPLRQRILERLSADGEASPTELARRLDERLPNVAYHVRILVELDCLELVRTRQVRGALEHYYRATAHPGSTLSSGRGCRPRSGARRSPARSAKSSPTRPRPASQAGSIRPTPRSGASNVVLDEQGWQDVAVLLEHMLASVQRIQADSAIRAAENETVEPAIETEIALLLFRRARST